MGNHLVEPALNCVVAFDPTRKNTVPPGGIPWLTNLAIRELYASDISLRIKELRLCGGSSPFTSRNLMRLTMGRAVTAAISMLTAVLLQVCVPALARVTRAESLVSIGSEQLPVRVAKEAYSADGSKVAFVAQREGDFCPRVYVSDADGTNLNAVSPRDRSASSPSFFPEGDRLVYSEAGCPLSGTVLPQSNIFIVGVNGTDRRQLTKMPGNNTEPAVSPDTRSVAFTSTRDGKSAIFRISLLSQEAERLSSSSANAHASMFSPDGKWIAFRVSCESAHAFVGSGTPVEELWIMHADGSGKQQLTTDAAPYGPYFSQDSTRIVYGSTFYGADGRPSVDVFSADLDGTGTSRLTHNFESAEDIRVKNELNTAYFSSIRNRERLGESKQFGLLKVVAYVFIGCSLLLMFFRVATAALPGIRSALFAAEQFLTVKGEFLFRTTPAAKVRQMVAGTRLSSSRRKRHDHKETIHRP